MKGFTSTPIGRQQIQYAEVIYLWLISCQQAGGSALVFRRAD
jgi:hypothetical protein